MYTEPQASARRGRRDPRVVQIARHHSRVLCDRDLWLRDLGMPALLPLEAVVAPVANARERGHLPLHRDLARPREDVLAIVARRHRILEVRVSDVLAELRHRRFRLLSTDERDGRPTKWRRSASRQFASARA